MTTPAFEPPDYDAHLDAYAAHEQAITTYLAAVDRMPGPLGRLLAEIGKAYTEFGRAEQDGATTMGEYHRLANVMDRAMLCRTWLQEDQ